MITKTVRKVQKRVVRRGIIKSRTLATRPKTVSKTKRAAPRVLGKLVKRSPVKATTKRVTTAPIKNASSSKSSGKSVSSSNKIMGMQPKTAKIAAVGGGLAVLAAGLMMTSKPKT